MYDGKYILTGQVTLAGKDFSSRSKRVVGAAVVKVAKTLEARRTMLKATMMKIWNREYKTKQELDERVTEKCTNDRK